MQPRPYQLEALDALHEHLCTKKTAPCIVLATGAGKSALMAWAIQRYRQDYPKFRVAVLAHVQELVRQNSEKMQAIWPGAPIGIFSAGLGKREGSAPILFAGIQSVYKRACDLEPFDMIFVDEAHRIALSGDGMYRRFIRDAKMINPNVVVAGLTATPFRLAGGMVCGPKYALNEIIYETNIKALIEDGYLCKLKRKGGGEAQPDLKGVHIQRGEFVASELAAAVDTDKLVSGAVADMVPLLAGRKSILFFCVNIAHAKHVSQKLAAAGIVAPVISEETNKQERAALIDQFTAGSLRGICNVNVLSEGFDAQRVDAVVMLRPTASAGLYYQQCGRGLRIHPSKTEKGCLILDYAGNVERHGPIDTISVKSREKGTGAAPVKTCPSCREIVPAGVRTCPECGHEFPIIDIKHTDKAANAPILSSSEPWEILVDSVMVEVHQKRGDPNAPATLQVSYFGHRPEAAGNLAELGAERAREWIAFGHPSGSYARRKAEQWWKSRFDTPVPGSAQEAFASQLFLGVEIKNRTELVRVRQAGKYTEIIGYKLKQPVAMAGGR